MHYQGLQGGGGRSCYQMAEKDLGIPLSGMFEFIIGPFDCLEKTFIQDFF
jgi:hypothetical protein